MDLLTLPYPTKDTHTHSDLNCKTVDLLQNTTIRKIHLHHYLFPPYIDPQQSAYMFLCHWQFTEHSIAIKDVLSCCVHISLYTSCVHPRLHCYAMCTAHLHPCTINYTSQATLTSSSSSTRHTHHQTNTSMKLRHIRNFSFISLGNV